MTQNQTFFQNKTWLAIFLLTILFALLAYSPLPWNKAVENGIVDIQFKLRGSRQLSDDILFVFIGSEDIQALGGWPITRDYYWYATYILNLLQAKVIGIDISFERPDRNYPEFDESLAEIFHSTKKVCLPFKFSILEPSTEISSDSSVNLLNGKDPAFPLDIFKSAIRDVGFSNFGIDAIIREAPIVVNESTKTALSFGCQLARIFMGDSCQLDFKFDRNRLVFYDEQKKAISVPLNKQGNLYLNHFGDLKYVNTLSFVDLLQSFEPEKSSTSFKNKLVIIAVTAPGIANYVATPLSKALPASLIHATVADNILQQNYMTKIHAGLNLLHFVFLAVLASLIWSTKNRFLWLFGSLGIIVYFWIYSMTMFGLSNIIVPIFYPTLSFLAITILLGITRYVELNSKQEYIKSLLKQQVQNKQQLLAEARQKLDQLQTQLKKESALSEQTRELAEGQQAEIRKLEKELSDLNTYILPEKSIPNEQIGDIIYADSGKMAQLLELVAKVSTDDISVLILGETGTGKEIIARAIHNTSRRKNNSFVAINCGSLPETLLESELFGHEKGAFTGAQSRRKGRFELANGGTIFLDEITETTPKFQTRLLRVLQEGSFERLGGEQTLTVDVRVIAATNKNLQSEIENNLFRIDLYYRLNGFPIQLPALRERPEDIPLLAMFFLKKYKYDRVAGFSDRAMDIMQKYHWPGNVRELENMVRRAALLSLSENRKMIRENDLPPEMIQQKVMLDYVPLENQILEMLRLFDFSRSAITQAAKALGNRDRGTITEYFRGICFEKLVEKKFHVEETALNIAGNNESTVVARVQTKIEEYLTNVQCSIEAYQNEGTAAAIFKGLPKKYHNFLEKIIIHFIKE